MYQETDLHEGNDVANIGSRFDTPPPLKNNLIISKKIYVRIGKYEIVFVTFFFFSFWRIPLVNRIPLWPAVRSSVGEERHIPKLDILLYFV